MKRISKVIRTKSILILVGLPFLSQTLIAYSEPLEISYVWLWQFSAGYGRP